LALAEFALLAVSSLVAVMEPFTTVAIYATLTRDMERGKQRRIAAKSTKMSFLVLSFFALAGQIIFKVFNITVAAFEIAGGILLIAVALRMLNPKKEELPSDEARDITFVPLVFPLTAGPGEITAVMLLISSAQSLLEASFVFVGIAAGIIISYVGMRYAAKMLKLLGDEGLKVISAFMAIIVLAMAVQFVISGITEAFAQNPSLSL